MSDAFLRADERNDLFLGVELHAEPPHIPVGDAFPELRKALGLGVAVVWSVVRGRTERVYDVVGRRNVGIAYAEADDLDALRLLFGDLPADLHEKIRGDPIHSFGKPHLASMVNLL